MSLGTIIKFARSEFKELVDWGITCPRDCSKAEQISVICHFIDWYKFGWADWAYEFDCGVPLLFGTLISEDEEPFELVSSPISKIRCRRKPADLPTVNELELGAVRGTKHIDMAHDLIVTTRNSEYLIRCTRIGREMRESIKTFERILSEGSFSQKDRGSEIAKSSLWYRGWMDRDTVPMPASRKKRFHLPFFS